MYLCHLVFRFLTLGQINFVEYERKVDTVYDCALLLHGLESTRFIWARGACPAATLKSRKSAHDLAKFLPRNIDRFFHKGRMKISQKQMPNLTSTWWQLVNYHEG